MKLGKNWILESDELNVTLSERHVNQKTGEEYYLPHSYFSTVENALVGLVNLEINRTGLKSVEDVVAKVKELKAWVVYQFQRGQNQNE